LSSGQRIRRSRTRGGSSSATTKLISQASFGSARASRWIRTRFRYPGEASPRVQAPAPKRAPHRHPLQPPQKEPPCRPHPAHLHFRGKAAPATSWRSSSSSSSLPWRKWSTTTRTWRPAQGGFFPRFQREELPAHLPGGGSFPSRSPPRARKLRDREHEVCHERGADHRDPGWGERGDPRGGRRRKLFPLRPDGGGGDGIEGPGLPSQALLTKLTPSSGRPSTVSLPGTSPGGMGNLFKPLVDSLLTRTNTCHSPTISPTWTVRTGWARRFADRQRWTRMSILNTAGRGNFPRIAPSGSTVSGSGEWSR